MRERRVSGKASKVIAITGTNGKSTTTALIHHLLASAGLDAVLGGNIGKAVLDLPAFETRRHYVLEFSSFQLDLTPSLDADAAILLNITPDHLDRHGTLENYAAVKEMLFRRLGDHGTAIIGADDPLCDAVALRATARGLNTVRISACKPVETGIYAKGFRSLPSFEWRYKKSSPARWHRIASRFAQCAKRCGCPRRRFKHRSRVG